MKENYEMRSAGTFKVLYGIDYAVRMLIMLCAILVTIFCAWALDRGFDITDEAYYLLLAIYPESVKLYISAQQWITGGIWQVTGSLVAFRAAGMILLVVSASVLAFGAIVTLSQSKLKFSDDIGGRAVILASSIICALVYIETINFSPSYNLLATSGAYAAAGLVLLALHTDNKWSRWGLLFLVGGALSVEFVSKPSSGIVTFCLMVLWIFFLSKTHLDKVIDIAVITFSVVFFILTIAFTQATIVDVKIGISQGLELFRMVQNEPVGVRLARYFSEFFHHSVRALSAHVFLIFAVVLYLFTRRLIFIGIIFLFLVYSLVLTKYHLGYSGQYELQYVPQMEFAFVLFLLALLVSMSVWRNNRPFVVFIAGLVSLPYTVGVGTGNSIFTQIISSLAPWGVVIATIASLRFTRRFDKVLVVMLLTVFVVAFSLQIVAGVFRAPYHLVQPLVKQVYPVKVDLLGSVKVDAETRDFIDDLRIAVETCGIAPGTPFFGLYNVPGVALVLQAVPVLTPWLNNLAQAEAVLKFGPADKVRSSVLAVLLDADGNNPPFPERLGSFPKDFQYCGAATFPLLIQKVQIWKPK